MSVDQLATFLDILKYLSYVVILVGIIIIGYLYYQAVAIYNKRHKRFETYKRIFKEYAESKNPEDICDYLLINLDNKELLAVIYYFIQLEESTTGSSLITILYEYLVHTLNGIEFQKIIDRRIREFKEYVLLASIERSWYNPIE